MKDLPIGIENFKELIDKDYYYVDKTLFIKDIWKEKVALYTRPRRFGKTLNMSMLYYFFSIKQKENSYLFQGFGILKQPDVSKYQNQYPVIFLTMKDLDRDSYDLQIEKFRAIISNIILQNKELLQSTELDYSQINLLKQYKDRTSSVNDLMDSLLNISICLETHYHKKVIILIDEYDVPLHSAYLNQYYDAMVKFLKGVFSAALKTNDALEKGILTGCLRIAKESIFTGLNNFNVYSLFHKKSSSCFGFTSEETTKLLQYFNLSNYRNIMKEWYDGYLFGDQDIYNPWSVLKYIHDILQLDTDPKSYWANTSGNDLIYRYIQEGNTQMKQEFDILYQGGTIEKTIKSELTYREIEDLDNIYSFLLFTGYLKPVKKGELDTYQLMIPNKEVQNIYVTSFMEWFQKQLTASQTPFTEALLKENPNQASKILNDILFQSLSFYDYGEASYHALLIGLINHSDVYSNRESGLGRYDIAILPRSLDEKGIVIELKTVDALAKLKHASQIACEQIKEKKYIEGLYAQGYENIIGYGIAFYKKTCVITKVEF